MKKISTLLAIALFISASSFAQWTNDRHHDDHNSNYGYGNGGYNNDQYRILNFRSEDELLRDMNLSRSQERKISRINQQFQQASFRIQNDRFSSGEQKRFQLQRLEQQRKQDIMNQLSGFQRERYNAWCVKYYNGNTINNGHYGQGNGRW